MSAFKKLFRFRSDFFPVVVQNDSPCAKNYFPLSLSASHFSSSNRLFMLSTHLSESIFPPSLPTPLIITMNDFSLSKGFHFQSISETERKKCEAERQEQINIYAPPAKKYESVIVSGRLEWLKIISHELATISHRKLYFCTLRSSFELLSDNFFDDTLFMTLIADRFNPDGKKLWSLVEWS